MLPTTRAVAIQRPIERFSLRGAGGVGAVDHDSSSQHASGVRVDQRRPPALDPEACAARGASAPTRMLEDAVLVEDVDLVEVGVVRKPERLLEPLLDAERLAFVVGRLQLVAADRERAARAPRRRARPRVKSATSSSIDVLQLLSRTRACGGSGWYPTARMAATVVLLRSFAPRSPRGDAARLRGTAERRAENY